MGSRCRGEPTPKSMADSATSGGARGQKRRRVHTTGRRKMAIKKLLFIHTNIWLDFYRARSEAGLTLLKHAEEISSEITVTYQLEGEFKRNRQKVILEAMRELKAP